EDLNKDQVLATIGAIEKESTHPLAKAITTFSAPQLEEHNVSIKNMKTHSGEGVSALINGELWKIGKPDFIGEKIIDDFQQGITSKLANEGKKEVCVISGEIVIEEDGLKDVVCVIDMYVITTIYDT